MSRTASSSSVAIVSACLLAPLTAAGADNVLFNPRVDKNSIVQTGTEARFRFHLKQWDSSLSADFDEGNVGTTAEVSNDPATLLNTEYAFNLSFEANTKLFTWTLAGGALAEPSVITVVETDEFNAIRFNARTKNPAFTVTFREVEFAGLPGIGKWRPDGSVSNTNDGQRVVAQSGLLSESDWSVSGYVSADGTSKGDTKMWIVAQNVALTPVVARAVPEPSRAALLMGGLLVILGWRQRQGRLARRHAERT